MSWTDRPVMPNDSNDRTIRSSDTLGSPASILATRDWLDLSSAASSFWVRFRFRRVSRRDSPNANLSSM